MKIRSLTAVLLAAGLGIASLAPVARAEAKKTRRIPQLMRENGFKHQTASWTTVTTQTDDQGKANVTEAKMWLSGDKYRMESKDQKGKTMVFLDDGADVYLVNLDEKKAYKWGASVEKMFGNVLNSDMVAESARQRKAAKKQGSETVEGKPCDIYAYKSTATFMDNAVTSDVKEWVWAKEGFPLKSKVNTPKHTMKIVFMTTEVPAAETLSVVKDLALDKPVDGALFTLPAGVKVETMEMPASMNGGQGAPASAQNAKPAEPKSGAAGGEKQDGPPPEVQKMLKGLF
jgi:outer membrane lipoprotein-sorting protein